MNTYNDFKNSVSSQKIVLATLDASKRLVAWTNHSGSIYKKVNQVYPVIVALKYQSNALTQVYSLASMVAGSFFNDTTNNIIYIWLSDSSNPDNKFIFVTFRKFYSNIPVDLPHDLNTGFELPWEPSIAETSKFGVEIDTINQQSEAIEGSGSLTLYNDQTWWPANFDKLFFDNHECSIYSYNKSISATESKLLFRGKVESKSYAPDKISFKLKDLISTLRDAVPLTDNSSLVPTYRPSLSHYKAKRRMIFGRLKGFLPTNIDQVIDSRYPLTGTIVATGGSTTVTGTGTLFMTELYPDDRLDINGTLYTIGDITSNTSLELTENFSSATTGSLSVNLLPSGRKRYINRIWSLAGHQLCQPVPTTLAGSSASLLVLTSTENIYAGDRIYVGPLGSGELVRVDEVVNQSLLRLSTSLTTYPQTGTLVTRFCVQNVRIDGTELLPWRDFTVDPVNAIMTLRDTAEENAGEVRNSLQQANFTNGSNIVTNHGSTSFKSSFYPGYIIRPSGQAQWYQIMSVIDDVTLKLSSNFVGTSTPAGAYIQYKSLIFDVSENKMSCEILGRTVDGLSSSPLITTGPDIVKTLLQDAGLTNSIDLASFNGANAYASEEIAFAIPEKFENTALPIYRDVISNVNKNIFGILYQTNEFKLGYDILRPSNPVGSLKLEEADIVDFNFDSTNKNMVKTVKVNYLKKEYDTDNKESSFLQVENISDIASYIINTNKEKIIESYLVNEVDAQRLANRWGFLLEFSSNTLTVTTKLQTIEVEINDIIDVSHRKLFERFGGTSSRKLMSVQRVDKSGSEVELELVDLSNAFNRIGLITNGTTTWANSDEETKIYTGYISDDNGMIDNDESSFYVNLIW